MGVISTPGAVKVYIAARTEDQARAAAIRALLHAHGVGCTSRWLDLDDVPRVSPEGAAGCLEDIDRCDVFLLVNPREAHRSGTGGRHTETGFAIGRGKPTLIFGEAENVFHTYARVQVVPDDVTPSVLATIVKLAAVSGTPLPVMPAAL